MEFLNERSRRVILSVMGTMFFFYSCVILPLFRILPYGSLKKTAELEMSPLGSIQGSIESKFYFDTIELHYWISLGSIRGQLEFSYSSIGKNSDYWFLWQATEIWGPIAILLGIIAVIILFTDSLSILVQEKPALSSFGRKIAVVIGIVAVSIEWLLFLLLWLSGEAEAGTAVGKIGFKPVPGWPLLFLNLLGVLGLLWGAFQEVKAARA